MPTRRRLLLCATLWLGAAALAHAAQVDAWVAIFAALPPLPTTPAEAARKISARHVLSEGLGIEQLRIEVADAGLRGLQRQLDDLYTPIVKAGSAQLQRAMEAANKDSLLTELARKIDETWNPSRPPSPEAVRQLEGEIERVLGPLPVPGQTASSAAPRSAIAAYRRELQSATPRAAQFLQRLAERQRHYAAQHALTDREALAQTPGAPSVAVARHHALAQRQLAEATSLLREAHEVVAPRVQRLAELARASERDNAPPSERHEALVAIKAYAELLLTLHREALQDVGFWAGIRVAATGLRYELSLAPGFDLRANGEQAYGLPYYPLGRAIVVGLAPGIR